ncbi:MAG: hypothetical protein IPM23_03110 [Candidatus Melainabacteria bacterium]|nr:hypothetical protein [Candidatus Melainabacteria bacterium]
MSNTHKLYTAIIIALVAVTVVAVNVMNSRARSYTSPNVISVTEATFEKEVVDATTPVLIFAHAPGCDPCDAYRPVFHHAADANAGKIKFVSVDLQANPTVAQLFGLRSVPVTIYLNPQGGGRFLAGGIPGALSKDQLERLLQAFQDPNAPLMEISIEKSPQPAAPDNQPDAQPDTGN